MSEQTLVTEQVLERVIEESRRVGLQEHGGRVFRHEPLLERMVQDRLRSIAGKLVLSGAPSETAREVADEIDRLVIFAAASVQEGYRSLLADLIPDDIATEDGSRDGAAPAA